MATGWKRQADHGRPGPLFADVQIHDVPLRPAQMHPLCRTGRPGPAAADAPATPEGMPVEFETPIDGLTSVALNESRGAQLRELLIGEKIDNNIVVAEIKGDRVEFCTVLFTGSHSDIEAIRGEALRDDVRTLGLVDGRDVFNCRFTWTDANRDLRMQADEVRRFAGSGEGPNRFYMSNDGSVDDAGSIVVHDHFTASVVRFPLLGFDDRGNPLYRWDHMETLWSRHHPPRYVGLDYWQDEMRLMATRADEDGNVNSQLISQPPASCPAVPHESS